MLLMLVGLQGIPDDVYEAARIDGASPLQIFRRITLPLLKPTLALTTVLCVTGSLLAFEQFYILTKGGPDNSTITVVQLIYGVAFQGQNDLGVAGALSVIVLLALDRHQRRPAARLPARPRRSTPCLDRPRPPTIGGVDPCATPYWVFTAALALIFLYPLVWTAISSVAPRAGTSQVDGWGFGNYVTLANYQAGIWVYLFNSLFVSLLTVVLTLVRLAARRLRLRAVQLPRQEPAVPRGARDPDGAVRDPAHPALRAAQRGRALATRSSASRSCSRCSSCRSRCS